VTRQRLFLETLENVLQKSNGVIIEKGKQGQEVVPPPFLKTNRYEQFR
jgi:hypothetical protein